GVLPRGTREGTAKCWVLRDCDGTTHWRHNQKTFLHTLDIRGAAEYFSSRVPAVTRAISAGPFRQSGHTHLGRMVMSGSAMLAPRAGSDSAIDREARGAVGGGVDRHRTWVG